MSRLVDKHYQDVGDRPPPEPKSYFVVDHADFSVIPPVRAANPPSSPSPSASPSSPFAAASSSTTPSAQPAVQPAVAEVPLPQIGAEYIVLQQHETDEATFNPGDIVSVLIPDADMLFVQVTGGSAVTGFIPLSKLTPNIGSVDSASEDAPVQPPAGVGLEIGSIYTVTLAHNAASGTNQTSVNVGDNVLVTDILNDQAFIETDSGEGWIPLRCITG